MEKVNVVIIGTGHYALGLSNQSEPTDKDLGVVLPSLLYLKQEGKIGDIKVAGRTGISSLKVIPQVKKIQDVFGMKEEIEIFPKATIIKQEDAYLSAFKSMNDPKAAIIVTPDSTHKKIMLDCIKHDVNFLVVKPAVTKVKDLDELLEATSKKKLITMVDYHKFYDEHNTSIQTALEQHRIGNIHNVVTRQTQRKSMQDIYKKRLKDVNINHYLGSHYIHMVAHLTRAEPISVIARQQFGLNKESPDMIETNVVWEHPRHYKFTSYHIAGWCDPNTTTGMTYQDMQFIGSEGNIQSDQKKRGLEIVTEKGVEHPNPYFFNVHSKNMRSQYGMVSIETFVNAVQRCHEGYSHRDLMNGLPSLEESKNVTKILEAADKSLETGKEVYL